MPNIIVSPNMNLPVPIPGVDPGPDYALNLNSSLNIIDSHNHSSGQGVQIQPNGLNINSDLTFQNNNALSLRAARFSPQTSPIPNSGADIGELYVSGNELYYNDVTGGNQVKITTNGSVNSGAGSITGLPSGTASATFNSGTFVWQSATATAANMDAGSYIFRNSGASSKGLTLNPPPAMSSNLSLTLPVPPASNTSFLQIDTSGNISSSIALSNGILPANLGTITDNITLDQSGSGNTLRVKPGGISTTQLGTITDNVTLDQSGSGSTLEVKQYGIAQKNLYIRTTADTASAGNVMTTPLLGVTNITSSTPQFLGSNGTLVTTGRPVIVMIYAFEGSYISCTAAMGGILSIQVDGTSAYFTTIVGGSAPTNIPVMTWIYTPSAGTHTYSLYASVISSGTISMNSIGIIAYEI